MLEKRVKNPNALNSVTEGKSLVKAENLCIFFSCQFPVSFESKTMMSFVIYQNPQTQLEQKLNLFELMFKVRTLYCLVQYLCYGIKDRP